jgi:septal ring factor EnvC (AmiA/AmiB activator)
VDRPPTGARRRRVIAATMAGATLAVCAGVSFAGAASPSLSDRIDSAQSDAGALSDRIDAQGGRIASLTEQARRAGAQVMVLNAQIEQTAARSRELAAKLDAAEKELERVRAEYDAALAELSDRLVAIYKGSEPDYTTVVLNSHGYDDLATRTEYLQALHDADLRLAQRVADLRSEVSGRVGEISDLKSDIDEQAQSLSSERTQFAASQSEANRTAAAVGLARSSAQSDLSDVQSQISDLEQQQAEQQSSSSGAPAYEGGPYAIPTYIVMCESGGNYHALNASSGAGGAYQILPSTWRAYGGQGLPHQAPKAEQDRIAGEIWRDSGPSAWSCA